MALRRALLSSVAAGGRIHGHALSTLSSSSSAASAQPQPPPRSSRHKRHRVTWAPPTGSSQPKFLRPEQYVRRRLKKPDPSVSKPPLRLRVADARVGALLASRTEPREFVALCKELHRDNEVDLLAATNATAWNVALQNRIKQDDADGARAVLELVMGFAAENASESLWSDLLFTLLRQRSHFSAERDIAGILTALRHKCGDDFVARVVVSLVNGCANIKMFDQARFLVKFHSTLKATTVKMPPQVLGNLLSKMVIKKRFHSVMTFMDEVSVPIEQMQAQMWIALFRSCAQTGANLSRHVDRVIEWFHVLKQRPSSEHPKFEAVLGAVVQNCVTTGNERLALRLFDAMTGGDDAPAQDEDGDPVSHIPSPRLFIPDENIYVNILKAILALHDNSLFRDVYRRMASDGVARSAGFGSAIRFCHVHHDSEFLEEVLGDAFAVEEATRRRWFLPLEQYNDALGCLAETKSYDLAKDLFHRMLDNPHVAPDHITMVEMVENYRVAPLSDVFELMEVFLEFQMRPNMHVFTSLLAKCGRHRLINDALALVSAMKKQGISLDIKTFTALGFVYGTHAHLDGIVETLKEMGACGIATDEKFFDVVMDGVYAANGIDMCFSLFRATLDAELRIPKGMYASLIRIGTKVGLVERTLHVAYNMECDGFPITSAQLLELMQRCEANVEVMELTRTFLLLHQGRNFATNAEQPDARFSQEVYEDMVSLLSSFSQRAAIAKVKQLAEANGYELS